MNNESYWKASCLLTESFMVNSDNEEPHTEMCE
jgi:hypothetical protein